MESRECQEILTISGRNFLCFFITHPKKSKKHPKPFYYKTGEKKVEFNHQIEKR